MEDYFIQNAAECRYWYKPFYDEKRIFLLLILLLFILLPLVATDNPWVGDRREKQLDWG